MLRRLSQLQEDMTLGPRLSSHSFLPPSIQKHLIRADYMLSTALEAEIQ